MTKRLGKGFTLIELMIVVAIIGILAAIAIPNFIRFQARSKQSEVKTNLKALYTGQKSRFGEKDRYAITLGEIGFSPERGNRYYYDLGQDMGGACPTLEDRKTNAVVAAGTLCGVEADSFRYGPEYLTAALGDLGNRTVATFQTAVTGNTDLAPDFIGVDDLATGCPMCDWAAHAVGNIDNDVGDDEWYVASNFESQASAGCAEETLATMPDQPGAPVNTRNDVNCD